MREPEMTSTQQIARAIQVAPRTKRFELRDEDGIRYDGSRTELVLAALSRSDKTPDLSAQAHTVAYAIRKSLVTARMNAVAANKLTAMTPYRVCALVAAVIRECPETTTGGICDGWLPANIQRLVAA
jgi:hypothetical protein